MWEDGGTLTGTVSGNTLNLHYVRPFPYTYTGDFEGTIGADVINGGTFSDSDGNNLLWTATGTSVEVYPTCSWSDFVKIVAVPNGALQEGDNWTLDGTVIGPAIWGDFAIIQEVSSDPCGEGIDLGTIKSELRSGLGNW